MELAVVIVTWNVRDLALQTLRTLYDDLANSALDATVYVVDSASSDGTAAAIRDQFPDVCLTASEENLGFARGNNTALRQIGFDEPDVDPATLPHAVYLLNPDTITKSGATRTLYDALFSADDVGIVGANLTYGDGSFQHGAFAFPGLRQLYAEFFALPGRFREGHFNGRYPRFLYNGTKPFDVDFTLGATMMLRREAILQTGLFDEDFFMYAEEVDWAWRIHNAGWRALLVPAAYVVHLGGQSTGQASARSTVNLWESRLRLYRKHYPAWKRTAAFAMVRVGMLRKLRRLAFNKSIPPEQRTELETAYQSIIDMTTQ
ncbi:MAG: glycosyltransferase family 2 protein [Chloroflexota bacterium]